MVAAAAAAAAAGSSAASSEGRLGSVPSLSWSLAPCAARATAALGTSRGTALGALLRGHARQLGGLVVGFAAASAAAAPAALRRRRPRALPQLLRGATSTAGAHGGYNTAVGGRVRISQILDAADGGRSFVGSIVTVCGWVRTVRAQKDFTFVKVNDGSTFRELQAIIGPGAIGMEAIGAEGAGASVRIEGLVVESPGQGQAVELSCASAEHSVRVLGSVDSKAYPLAKKQHSVEFLRSIAHLRPRSNLIGAVSRVRSALAAATHRFFQDRGFLYVHTPIITTADCEGAGEMFRIVTDDGSAPAPEVQAPTLPSAADEAALQASKAKVTELKRTGVTGPDLEAAVAEMKRLKELCGEIPPSKPVEKKKADKEFFGQPAYLTVSGQLSVENFCCALGDVYTFGPTFRAETSNTTRHLAEFWMIEPEMAFADLSDDMNCAEEYIRHCARTILETCSPDVEFFEARVDKDVRERLKLIANEPFKRISYTQAVEELQKVIASGEAKFEYEVAWGKELQTEHEKWLTDKLYMKPTIVYNYPKDCKAFYMRLNDDGKTVAAMDILCPGIGELVGGSQREERLHILDARIAEMGMKKEDYWWYRDLRQYGSVPHAGFGVGFERLVMLCTGVQNIRDVIPFPRYAGHAEF